MSRSAPDPAPAAAGEEVFVGRRPERAELERVLDEALNGRARLCLISGEAGVGKTTLVEQLAAHAETAGVLVLWGRAWEGGGAPVYWPWLQVLRAYRDEVGDETFLKDVGPETEVLGAIFPALAEELTSRRQVPQPSADPDRFEVFDAVARILARAARRVPLVVVLDDLHAADRSSLLLLRFVARELRSSRLLTVGTYRGADARTPPANYELLGALARDAVSIPLGGLSESEVGRLIELVAGEHAPGSAQRIYALTDGNPFFVDEIVRLLRADGWFERPGSLPPELPLPAAVREAVAERARGLSDRATRLLTTASVLGSEVDVRAPAAVAGLTGVELVEALEECERAGMLARVPGHRNRWRFAHALIRETVYTSLAAPERLALHVAAAEALERLYGAAVDRHVAEVAHHFVTGAAIGGTARAVDYGMRAGDRAMRLLAWEEAANRYERVLLVMELDLEPNERRRCETMLALGAARRRAGDADAGRRTFVEAAEIARAAGLSEHLARAALGLGAGLGGYGFVDRVDPELVALLDEALEVLPAHDSVLRVRVLSRLASELYFTGEARRRDELSREAVRAAERLGDPSAQLVALYGRHLVSLAPDAVDERLASADEVCRIAREIDDRDMLFHGHHARLATLLELGDRPGVDREVEECERLAEQLRQPLHRWRVVGLRAMQATLAGRFEEAAALSARALELGSRAQAGMATVVFGAQTLARHWAQGRLGEIEPQVRHMAEMYDNAPAWRAALAYVLLEEGREADAAAELHRLTHRGLDALPWDANWMMAATLTAHVAAGLRQLELCEELLDRLLPHVRLDVTVAGAALSIGSAAAPVGVLLRALGRFDDALLHLDAAVAQNIRTRNVPFAVWALEEQVRTYLGRGSAEDERAAAAAARRAVDLARRCGMQRTIERLSPTYEAPKPSAPARAASGGSGRALLFRRVGELWEIGDPAAPLRLRDLIGLHHLQRLLAQPDVEVHVLDLAGAAARANAAVGATAAQAREAGLTADGGGSAGPPLDGTAKQQYRARIDELRAEIDEAESFCDAERASRAREELEFVVDELRRAVGLGGRDRPAFAAAEKARLNVTRAIKAVIRRIEEHDAELGRHLRDAVRTGTFCSYSPPSYQRFEWALRD